MVRIKVINSSTFSAIINYCAEQCGMSFWQQKGGKLCQVVAASGYFGAILYKYRAMKAKIMLGIHTASSAPNESTSMVLNCIKKI